MKITKIPNFGDYGVYIDGLDLASMSSSDYESLQNELYTKYLLVVFRNTNLGLGNYSKFIGAMGTGSFGMRPLARSLGMSRQEFYYAIGNNKITDTQQQVVTAFRSQLSEYSNECISIVKLVGASNDSDEQFLDGDLHWHADESMDISFCDTIALYGEKNLKGSATCFLTTAKWYDELSESTKSELRDMIGVHEYDDYGFSDNLTDVEKTVIQTTTGTNTRLPIVVNSRGGFQGLHIPYNTMKGIEGMSDSDFVKFKKFLKDSLFKEEYMCEHWYEHDNDLVLFDNAVTIHKRTGSTSGRIAYRAPFYFNNPVSPRYLQPEFQKMHEEDMLRY